MVSVCIPERAQDFLQHLVVVKVEEVPGLSSPSRGPGSGSPGSCVRAGSPPGAQPVPPTPGCTGNPAAPVPIPRWVLCQGCNTYTCRLLLVTENKTPVSSYSQVTLGDVKKIL